MNIMRYTIVDEYGTVSFIAPCEALVPLVAGCARDPRTVPDLLHIADEYNSGMREAVLCGLAVFDEHNTRDSHQSIHGALDHCRSHEVPVFRVVDSRTREASLTPVHAGVVVFNLRAKRIVQIQNSYAEIQRRGRSRAVKPASPERRLIKYELPRYWALVPGD
jgi:hypothetical protein